MSEFAANREALSSIEDASSSPLINDAVWEKELDDEVWDSLDNDWLFEGGADLEPYFRMHGHHNREDDGEDWNYNFDSESFEIDDEDEYNFDDLEIYNDLVASETDDIHPDTEEVTQHIVKELQTAAFTSEVDEQLDAAQEKYGAEFDEAFSTIIESADAALAQRILSHASPGEELVRVFRQMRLLNEIPDGDLNKWAQKKVEGLLQEALIQEAAEKAIQKAAEDALREESLSPQTFYPPPSIIRAPGSSGPYRETIPLSAVSYAFGE